MPLLYSHTKGRMRFHLLAFPACLLTSDQAGAGGWGETTISPLGKAQLTEPSRFLLAVDSAETTAAEFIMVILKAALIALLAPRVRLGSLAAGTRSPSYIFISC